MKYTLCIGMCLLFASLMQAQRAATELRNANKLYREKRFREALPGYQRAAAQPGSDALTHYNLGNAYFRNDRFEEAAKSFDMSAAAGGDAHMRQVAFYNKGVSLSRQNKLEESIAAYKRAVILDPADTDARINLQKALLELRKKQPPKQENQENNKQKKQQQKNNDPKNQTPPSKLTRKQVEQLLKALQQKEQQVQQKMQHNRNRAGGQQEKNW